MRESDSLERQAISPNVEIGRQDRLTLKQVKLFKLFVAMNKRKWTDQQFIQAVKSSLSYAEVIRKLGLKEAGSNYDTVKRKIKELNLDISHMTGKIWNAGKRYTIKSAQPLQEILVKDSTFINSNNLRKRLLKEQVKEHRCECCGNSLWLNQKIPLELHHIISSY